MWNYEWLLINTSLVAIFTQSLIPLYTIFFGGLMLSFILSRLRIIKRKKKLLESIWFSLDTSVHPHPSSLQPSELKSDQFPLPFILLYTLNKCLHNALLFMYKTVLNTRGNDYKRSEIQLFEANVFVKCTCTISYSLWCLLAYIWATYKPNWFLFMSFMPSRNINLIALPFTSTLPLLCFVLLSKKWLPRRQGFQAARWILSL